ncbi:MAG: hypothetical protein GXP49_13380, partial [Deltaproteobacteria bacterium]|nr:hypothetical protein [Deltaproteobacteria bacterium]
PFGIKHLRLLVPGRAGNLVNLDNLMRIPTERRPRTINKTLLKESNLRLIDLRKRAGPTAFPFRGALSGFTIVLSPGHGYYWNSSLGWTTQRGEVNGLIEDIHNNEIVYAFLAPALERAGAKVITCRERTRQLNEFIADDSDGPSVYTEQGSWTKGASQGFKGGSYRVCPTEVQGGSIATWKLQIKKPGRYPVYVAFKAGSNRVDDAHYTVYHAGGATTVLVDQTIDDLTWVYIGDYWFDPGQDPKITLDNRSSQIGYVIADTVRAGGGLGVISRGGSTSGQPKWKEAARYWTEFSGAPASVYDARDSDHNDDIVSRPLFADWRGGDVYFSLHTNAGGGTGTSTFIHDTNPSPGSSDLQKAVHTKVIRDLRALWKSDWYDRGMKSANFGEVREVRSMPAMLIECAFHDNPDDAEFIKNPKWRKDIARAIEKGIQDYLAPGTSYPPLPPTHLFVKDLGGGQVKLAWRAQEDALEPTAKATGFRIYRSDNGKGFDNGPITTKENEVTIEGLIPGQISYFRVAAYNQGGESPPSHVVAVRPGISASVPRILLVDGFDRLDKYVREFDNTFDFVIEHAQALADSGAYFDSASNEAVRDEYLSLDDYLAIDWLLGEESTVDHTLDQQERTVLQAYLLKGRGLIISGSEIGWDLDFKGDRDSRDFIHDILKTEYVSDDAGTYSVKGARGTICEDLTFDFDNGTHGRYDVKYPDELSPLGSSEACLKYQNAQKTTAGILYEGSNYRVAVLGFPFESIVGSRERTELMLRLLSVVASGYDQLPEQEIFEEQPTDNEPDALLEEDAGEQEQGSEAEPGPEPDADTDTDVDLDADTDTDIDSDTDNDTDVDTDIDTDIDTDTDIDLDTDTDTDTDSGNNECKCPECNKGCGCGMITGSAGKAPLTGTIFLLLGILLSKRRRD